MRSKQFVQFLSLLLAVFFSATLFAQHPGHGKHRGLDVERLKSEINLTDEQVNQIESIQAKYKTELEKLRAEEGEDRMAKREAMKSLMKAQKEEISAVLTEEQKAALKAKKEQMRERFENVDHEAMRAEIKAYHKENVQPVMLAQRQKLEEKITAEDKATIAELRKVSAERRKMHEGRKHHKRGMHGEDGVKRERKPRPEMEGKEGSFKQLKGLVEKYDADITALMEEIESERETWKAANKAIREKYMPKPEGEVKKGHGHHGKKMKHRKHHSGMAGKAHFLLMDPEGEVEIPETQAQGALTEVNIFPNPATTRNTINFEVKKAGQIRIELHNEAGNTLKVIVDGYREVGQYSEEVDLSNVKDGAYYYSIMDQQGVTTKAVIVSKQ
jgi:hypothetical protein